MISDIFHMKEYKIFCRLLIKIFVRCAPYWMCRILIYIPKFQLPATSKLLSSNFFSKNLNVSIATVCSFSSIGKKNAISKFMNVIYDNVKDYSNKRVAIVAHWDPDAVIDPYVLYYLRNLKDIGYVTILTSDKYLDLPIGIEDFVDAIVWRSCSGYDFTSWKGALECFSSLYSAEELLFTNDSIFAPMNPLGPIHAEMNSKDCDFWGLAESRTFVPHLQSFYLVFGAKAVRHRSFKEFWKTVSMTEDKDEVIARYELTLTAWFCRHGLKAAAYIAPDSLHGVVEIGPVYLYWRQLLRHCQFPCVKRDVLAGKYWWMFLDNWKDEISSTGYPVALISNYFDRIRRIAK